MALQKPKDIRYCFVSQRPVGFTNYAQAHRL